MYSRYEPVPVACAHVRHDLRLFLASHAVADDIVQDALVVANELVSNVIDHARTPFTVVVDVEPGRLCIAVTDGSSLAPVLRPHDPTAARGRGLQMVAAVSSQWFTASHVQGKTVTAYVTLPGGRPTA